MKAEMKKRKKICSNFKKVLVNREVPRHLSWQLVLEKRRMVLETKNQKPVVLHCWDVMNKENSRY